VDQARYLINLILSDPRNPMAAEWANDLLAEFQDGYPIESLRLLLNSSDSKVVDTATWIASELGDCGKSLLPDIAKLLKHKSKAARYFAIDCLLMWAGDKDEREIASVIAMLEDVEPAVRRKAMAFLSRASADQLRAAARYINSAEPESVHVRGLEALLNYENCNGMNVRTLLNNTDAICRKYGIVLAVRMFMHDNTCPNPATYTSDDDDISRFATDMSKLLEQPGSR
jgi:hypothetical protein